MQLKRRQYLLLLFCYTTTVFDKIRKIHQFVVVCTWCVTPVCSYFTKKSFADTKNIYFAVSVSTGRVQSSKSWVLYLAHHQKHITIEPSEVQWSGQAKVQFQVQGDFPGKKISGCRLSLTHLWSHSSTNTVKAIQQWSCEFIQKASKKSELKKNKCSLLSV